MRGSGYPTFGPRERANYYFFFSQSALYLSHTLTSQLNYHHQPTTPQQHTMATSLRNIKSLAPLLDRILVQRVKADVKTASGIFLPESTVEKLSEARVLAVGPGHTDKDGKRIDVSVKPGDRVLIPPYGGSPVKVGDEEYTIFRDHELLAKINE
ncbi:10 kDa chaperonin [Tricharina praecox]|uniref:10 kDa chaperonin n=1 Tax=Tricharina praecox TaxID=43433 RepID=UPI00221F5457|nr:10 kDa chaperonin [Tricharina praecox]KAI5848272.1 10 kDa chaperonin [Tricharina praecox]